MARANVVAKTVQLLISVDHGPRAQSLRGATRGCRAADGSRYQSSDQAGSSSRSIQSCRRGRREAHVEYQGPIEPVASAIPSATAVARYGPGLRLQI